MNAQVGAGTNHARYCVGCFALVDPLVDALDAVGCCSRCRSASRIEDALPLGSTLVDGRYHLGMPLGTPGGFGITYFGWDARLARRVAIKEFYPREFAVRDRDERTVHAVRTEATELMRSLLVDFLEEARRAARIDHEHVVRVLDFTAANGTGYIVMPYLEGETLASFRLAQPEGRIPWRVAVELIRPVLSALEAMHAVGMIHRDVKPSNIYLARDGRGETKPILIDFGSARVVTGSRGLTGLLSQGYAPPEQYDETGKGQGAWTDVYSVAVTLHELIVGLTPPSAPARQLGRALEDERRAQSDCPATLIEAIRKCAELDPARRFRAVGPLREALARLRDDGGRGSDAAAAEMNPLSPLDVGLRGAPATNPVGEAGVVPDRGGPSSRRRADPSGRRRGVVAGVAIVIGLVLASGAVWRLMTRERGDVPQTTKSALVPRDVEQSPSHPAPELETNRRDDPSAGADVRIGSRGVGGTASSDPSRPMRSPGDGERGAVESNGIRAARERAEALREAGLYVQAWREAGEARDRKLQRQIVEACRSDSAMTARRGGVVACPERTVR